MGHDRQVEILKSVLALSLEQTGHLEERRLGDLLICQKKRDALFDELKDLCPSPENPELKSLAGKIRDNDRVLTLNARSGLSELKGKLSKVSKGRLLLKAYGSR